MALRQGGHQVAQNSTTYTRPGSYFVTGVPCSQVSSANAGAVSPILRVGLDDRGAAQHAETNARPIEKLSTSDFFN